MCQPGRFIEAILTGFDPEALDLLRTKPTWRNSVRLLDLGSPIGPDGWGPAGFDLRRVEGGLLVQSWDTVEPDPTSGQVATGSRRPTGPNPETSISPGGSCACVKSNAIVLVRNGRVRHRLTAR